MALSKENLTPTHKPRATCAQRFGVDAVTKAALRRATCGGPAGVLSSVLLHRIEGSEELASLYQLGHALSVAVSIEAPEEKQIYKLWGGGFLEEVAPK